MNGLMTLLSARSFSNRTIMCLRRLPWITDSSPSGLPTFVAWQFAMSPLPSSNRKGVFRVMARTLAYSAGVRGPKLVCSQMWGK